VRRRAVYTLRSDLKPAVGQFNLDTSLWLFDERSHHIHLEIRFALIRDRAAKVTNFQFASTVVAATIVASVHPLFSLSNKPAAFLQRNELKGWRDRCIWGFAATDEQSGRIAFVKPEKSK
jgi:hypothetical protein